MGKERQWSRSIPKGDKGITNIGCMGGMLHYFDFHHLLFTGTGHNNVNARRSTNSRSSFRTINNGLEAPRNSLEKEDAKVSSSSTVDDVFFDIPVGIHLAPAFDSLPIRIKKKQNQKLSILEDDEERRIPQTPETPRTPSLVARLMGIDGLPDPAPSPPVTARQRPLSTRNHTKKNDKECQGEPRQPLRSISCNARTRDLVSRSLPDSPRVSSARSWEVEHRLSLQINRENLNSNSNHFHPSVGGDYSLPPSPTHYAMKPRRRSHDENRSPRRQEQAKEIVKQVKENIINNRRTNGCEDTIFKSKRITTREPQKKGIIHENVEKSLQAKPLAVHIPCKIPEVQTKTKLVDQLPNLPTLEKPPRVKPSRPPPPPPVHDGQVTSGKCNKATNERFTARFKKPCPPPSPPLATTNGEKQHFAIAMDKSDTPKLSRSPQNDESTSSINTKIGITRPPPDQDPEYKYVRSILHRGGFMSQPQKCYSTSHPIDPVVFHRQELDLPVEDWRPNRSNPLRYRWNRKLLFHLVQELLEDILQDPRKPRDGLLKKIWTQIERIPSSKCEYLDDVDGLVEADMARKNTRELTSHQGVRNEASEVARQVEEEIMDELIGETAASLCLFTFPMEMK